MLGTNQLKEGSRVKYLEQATFDPHAGSYRLLVDSFSPPSSPLAASEMRKAHNVPSFTSPAAWVFWSDCMTFRYVIFPQWKNWHWCLPSPYTKVNIWQFLYVRDSSFNTTTYRTSQIFFSPARSDVENRIREGSVYSKVIAPVNNGNNIKTKSINKHKFCRICYDSLIS